MELAGAVWIASELAGRGEQSLAPCLRERLIDDHREPRVDLYASSPLCRPTPAFLASVARSQRNKVDDTHPEKPVVADPVIDHTGTVVTNKKNHLKVPFLRTDIQQTSTNRFGAEHRAAGNGTSDGAMARTPSRAQAEGRYSTIQDQKMKLLLPTHRSPENGVQATRAVAPRE
jgi:hypothetical protein